VTDQNGKTTTYTYDYNGNTLTKTDSTGTTTYAWDFENRLTSVTLPGNGGTVSFAYDPFWSSNQEGFVNRDERICLRRRQSHRGNKFFGSYSCSLFARAQHRRTVGHAAEQHN